MARFMEAKRVHKPGYYFFNTLTHSLAGSLCHSLVNQAPSQFNGNLKNIEFSLKTNWIFLVNTGSLGQHQGRCFSKFIQLFPEGAYIFIVLLLTRNQNNL